MKPPLHEVVEVKACPFCNDRMMWVEDAPCFTHSFAATDGGACQFRHTLFHAEQLEWWNTRTSTQEERLRAALEPFSKALGNIADKDRDRWPDNETIEHSGAAEEITWGHLRAARQALSEG